MTQAVLARVSTAELSDPPTKPVITPEFHWSELESNFVAALPQNNFHIDSMDHSWTTDACKSFAQVARLGVSDYKLFNVTYDDCPEPWVFCHHTGAMASLVDVIEVRIMKALRLFSIRPLTVYRPLGSYRLQCGNMFGRQNTEPRIIAPKPPRNDANTDTQVIDRQPLPKRQYTCIELG